MTSAQITITAAFALAITSCRAFTTSSSTPSQTISRASIIQSPATTMNAALGNLHGESACFLPLLQNDEQYIAPRIVQVRYILYIYLAAGISCLWGLYLSGCNYQPMSHDSHLSEKKQLDDDLKYQLLRKSIHSLMAMLQLFVVLFFWYCLTAFTLLRGREYDKEEKPIWRLYPSGCKYQPMPHDTHLSKKNN